MSGTVEDEFAVYVQSHPELSGIARDAVAVGILKAVEGKGLYEEDLFRKFPGVDSKDLLAKLKALEQVGFVARLELLHGVLYYQTDASKEFLRLYVGAKGGFSV